MENLMKLNGMTHSDIKNPNEQDILDMREFRLVSWFHTSADCRYD